jgi:DNA-binding response OmpR family regulator
MTQPLIALIEDEDHLAQGLLFNLAAEGYTTHHEAEGDAALAWLLAANPAPAAVLLDVMLPGRDGFSILRALRAAGNYTPVLLLTARGRTEDILEGFAAGADDYLPKPFDLNILLARLTSLLRRSNWQATTSTPPPTPPITLNGRTIDLDLLEIRHADISAPGVPGGRSLSAGVATGVPGGRSLSAGVATGVPGGRSLSAGVATGVPGGRSLSAGVARLTLMEADLLRYLLDNPGRTIPRKELLENVWHVHEDTDTRAIDNFIVRLRRHLETDPAKPAHLLTVRGIGYRFQPTPEGQPPG